jgi:uncharacterized membrane protein YdjX (TVP38/TMEM64 family)
VLIYVKSGLLAVAAVVAVISLAISVWYGPQIALWLLGLADDIRGFGVGGFALFVAGEVLLTVIGIVPGALLGLVSGAIYGVALGFVAGAIGILVGAVAAFGLSRSMLRPIIGRVLQGWLAKLDQVVTGDGWRLVALLRMSPVMPFSITSYVLGFSGISVRDYAVGTLASLPLLLGYVVIGALGGMTLQARTPEGAAIRFGLLAVGAVATVWLTVHVSRLVSRALKSQG